MSNKVSNKEVQPLKVVENVPKADEALVPERLSDVDRLNLELAKSRRQTALAEAKTALAQNETAEANYKMTIMQLYLKYGLTVNDALNENGEIIKNGALNQPPENS